MWAIMWVVFIAVAITVVVAVYAVGRYALETLRRARAEEAEALERRRARREAALKAHEAGGDEADAPAPDDTGARGR